MTRVEKMPFGKHFRVIPVLSLLFLIFSFYSTLTLSMSTIIVNGHLDHLPHYNGSGKGVGEYYVDQQVEPEFVKPGELSSIIFSIQDKNDKDVYDVIVMVEIYDTLTGERMSVFPWTYLEIGDFEIPYVFPKVGNYQIVLSILNKDVTDNTNDNTGILNTVPPARTILYSIQNCECERVVFNVSITEHFGTVFTSVLYGAVMGLVIILGIVLTWVYLGRRKSKTHPISNYEFIKYCMFFLAVGASIVHIAVYPEHAALRLEYAIFLVSAAGAQFFYGISYIMLLSSTSSSSSSASSTSTSTSTSTGEQSRNNNINKNYISKKYYKKSVILNWIGLSGSMVLILLYAYSVIFPPPLSSNPYAEDVDLAGIIVKPMEIILVIGIIYLMRTEKKRYIHSIQTFDNKTI